MRGILFTELERYAAARGGADAFDALLERLAPRLATTEPYVTPGDYPAEELTLLVEELARDLGVSVTSAWRDFGSWCFAPLGTRYRLIAGHRDLAAFLAGLDRGLRTEIPRVYTQLDLDAVSIRNTPGAVQVTYRVAVPDCAFVGGLFAGACALFRFPLQVEEKTCRKTGARACRWEGRA